ncbi:MAG: phage portal protein [Cellulosilyticum sp.]|nr:phage portal protein [Cellulosilyticum sp.]
MDDQQSQGNAALNRLLQVRPNPYMSTYDLIYKLVTHYYLYNNAFVEVFCIRRFFNSDELLVIETEQSCQLLAWLMLKMKD